MVKSKENKKNKKVVKRLLKRHGKKDSPRTYLEFTRYLYW